MAVGHTRCGVWGVREAHILHRPELIRPQLHIGAALRQSAPPAMAAAADLAAQVLQAIPERTLEAVAEPLAYVVDFDQYVVAFSGTHPFEQDRHGQVTGLQGGRGLVWDGWQATRSPAAYGSGAGPKALVVQALAASQAARSSGPVKSSRASARASN